MEANRTGDVRYAQATCHDSRVAYNGIGTQELPRFGARRDTERNRTLEHRMSSDTIESRRRFVAGVAGAAFGTAVTTTSAQQQNTVAAANDAGLRDPKTEYARPPFPKQQQPWPGLASKMDPKPDHGETSYKGSGRLKGRKALITGGDSGIGRAAAIAYAREGADVAINYLPAEEADAREVIDLIRREGRKGVALPGDIKDEAFCRKLVGDAVAQLGGLDILVNNAARQISQDSLLDITTAQFDETFKTNVYAMFWITKAAVPSMKPGATIINTASINAYEPGENIIDYAATKGAIMIWTKGLAKQLVKQGIRVNAVAPGPFWTPLQVTGGQPAEKLPNSARTRRWAAGPAGRARGDLRAACIRRIQLLDGPGFARSGRTRRAVTDLQLPLGMHGQRRHNAGLPVLHLLDNIVWHSLTGAHASSRPARISARRYARGFSPIVGFADNAHPGSRRAAAVLHAGRALLLRRLVGPVPGGLAARRRDDDVQDGVGRARMPDAVARGRHRAVAAAARGAGVRARARSPSRVRSVRARPSSANTSGCSRATGWWRWPASAWRHCRCARSAACARIPIIAAAATRATLMLTLVRRQMLRGEMPFLHVMRDNTTRARAVRAHGLSPLPRIRGAGRSRRSERALRRHHVAASSDSARLALRLTFSQSCKRAIDRPNRRARTSTPSRATR